MKLDSAKAGEANVRMASKQILFIGTSLSVNGRRWGFVIRERKDLNQIRYPDNEFFVQIPIPWSA
jgi:hypothetical protein